MSYRVVDPFAANFNQQGELLAGGRFEFFEAGTTSPKAVYADASLSTSNGSTVELDASGRPSVDVWGSGSYRVRLYDANGVLVREADPIRDPAASTGATIPPLEVDRFLSNDGSNLVWLPVLQVPDPSGSAGKFLSTDGGNLTWQGITIPEPPTPDIEVTATSVKIGDGTDKLLLQTGSKTGTNAGGRSQTVDVTFPTPFATTPPFIAVTLTNSAALSPYNNQPSVKISSKSPTGFTAVFVMGELDDSNGNFNFNAAVQFDWMAIGKVN